MTNIISTTYNTNWIEHNRLIYEHGLNCIALCRH
jgi:hypothetical protein